MNIKIFMLTHSSIIMGEGNEFDDCWLIKNPVEIKTNPVMQNETPVFSVSFLPFLQYAKEAKEGGIRFSKEEIISVTTPVDDLYEHYNKFFNQNE